MLFGLCTDTGFFRHLGGGSADTYRADCAPRGARHVDCRRVHAGVRPPRAGLPQAPGRDAAERGKPLGRSAHRDLADDRRPRAAGRHQRGEDDLYRLLQTVKGNVAVALIREEGEGSFSVGLRSSPDVDVGAVAASFGGGGHRQASGFDITGSLDSVKMRVIAALAPLVGGSSAVRLDSRAKSAEM